MKCQKFLLPILITGGLFIFIAAWFPANAKWWQRPCIEERFEQRTIPIEAVEGEADAHPSGDCPTDASEPIVTDPPQPTETPQPTEAPEEEDDEDDNEDDEPSDGNPRIGGPEVLGLSYTSGSYLIASDILVLLGVLCLLLYAKSKLSAILATSNVGHTAAVKSKLTGLKQTVVKRRRSEHLSSTAPKKDSV